jgi:hypothetical protein
MYVRFTIPSDPERTPTGHAMGIVHAAGRLADDDRFESWAFAVLDDDYQWFADRVRGRFSGGRVAVENDLLGLIDGQDRGRTSTADPDDGGMPVPEGAHRDAARL